MVQLADGQVVVPPGDGVEVVAVAAPSDTFPLVSCHGRISLQFSTDRASLLPATVFRRCLRIWTIRRTRYRRNRGIPDGDLCRKKQPIVQNWLAIVVAAVR